MKTKSKETTTPYQMSEATKQLFTAMDNVIKEGIQNGMQNIINGLIDTRFKKEEDQVWEKVKTISKKRKHVRNSEAVSKNAPKEKSISAWNCVAGFLNARQSSNKKAIQDHVTKVRGVEFTDGYYSVLTGDMMRQKLIKKNIDGSVDVLKTIPLH